MKRELTWSFTRPLGHSFSTSSMTSPLSGAAPEAMSMTLLRSYCLVRGDFTSNYLFLSSTSHLVS